ncbi:HIT-like protein [Lentinula raphanica]|uniref:HIT-like protein n=1 Tax=Lentinula raphanica TaxID=153919 RepID=A0AA38PBT2_9AGAR|nr:HIT-like protein [Lentinula raphanica]KAJ3840023.1 HIT-like protein [Lentinula raphanica]KAJ3975819.1 HIT-like protein [Lentinula raphanica]
MKSKACSQQIPVAETSRYDPDCSFCHVSVENDFQVVWEDDELIAFKDRDPACGHHFQIIPRLHISSVRQLRKSDVDMIKTMVNVGHQLLEQLDVETSMRKMGFHIPPFNSVGHLHLHVQALPYKNLARRLKYPTAPGFRSFHKGFSWFSDARQTILILQEGRSVGIFPC